MDATWTPPERIEEKVKSWLVPPRLYIRYLHQKMKTRGEAELHLVQHLVTRDKVALDIGANKGTYSYELARHCEAVHAFEPNPKMFAILRRWARKPVQVHNLALSDQSGQAELRVPRSARGYSNQMGSLSAVTVTGDYKAVTVPTRRLDDWVADQNLGPVGFIKIDVEGFEMAVLRGAEQTLRRDRPNLLIELEERHTHSPLPDLIAEVCGYGYQAYVMLGGALRPFSDLDLVRHHRQPARKTDYIFNFIFLPT